jgi:hypothetical protein
MKQLPSTRQLAKNLHISERAIHRPKAAGKLKPKRVGRLNVFKGTPPHPSLKLCVGEESFPEAGGDR